MVKSRPPAAQRPWRNVHGAGRRQSLVSLWGHLGEVVMAETAIIEAMEATGNAKTSTADDVKGLLLLIAPRRMRERKWRQISNTS